MKRINIAIDGFSASGKGTTTKLLAKKLNYNYLDTGAMYRSIAYYISKNNIKIENITLQDLEKLNLNFNEKNEIILNGENIERLIRNENIAKITSNIAKNKFVRNFLTKKQKEIVKSKGFIAEGRDIGSNVIPNAEVKIFLTASVEIRAKRRLEDMKKQGILSNLEEVKKQIEERDHEDLTRELSPLIKVRDAIEIDTSNISIDEQVEFIEKIAKKIINA